MINKSGLEFTDISSEEIRRYVFSNGNDLIIGEPLWLHVSKSGGHRLLDKMGQFYYIKPNWDYIVWKAKDGQPNFVK